MERFSFEYEQDTFFSTPSTPGVTSKPSGGTEITEKVVTRSVRFFEKSLLTLVFLGISPSGLEIGSSRKVTSTRSFRFWTSKKE